VQPDLGRQQRFFWFNPGSGGVTIGIEKGIKSAESIKRWN